MDHRVLFHLHAHCLLTAHVHHHMIIITDDEGNLQKIIECAICIYKNRHCSRSVTFSRTACEYISNVKTQNNAVCLAEVNKTIQAHLTDSR